MNKCHVLKQLSAYLDNELSDTEKLKVSEHLKSCPVCAQELSRLEKLSKQLKAWQVAGLSESFDRSLRSKIFFPPISKKKIGSAGRNLHA